MLSEDFRLSLNDLKGKNKRIQERKQYSDFLVSHLPNLNQLPWLFKNYVEIFNLANPTEYNHFSLVRNQNNTNKSAVKHHHNITQENLIDSLTFKGKT